MQFVRSFFKRITDDLKQKKLIPLKILFFVHASTLLVLYPYLTIHMRELGINVEETAIMSAVTPVVSIVMPPLAGMLADKIGNFRLLLALFSALGGASALFLLAVPVGRITVTFPLNVDLLASCDSGSLRLQQVRDHPCSPVHPFGYDVNLTVLSCGFVCELPHGISSEEIEAIVHANSYDVHLKSQTESQRLVYRNTVSSLLARKERPITDQSTSRIMINDPYFNSTATKVAGNRIFFPSPQLYQIDCYHEGNNATCLFGKKNYINDSIEEIKEMKMFRIRITHDAQKNAAEVRNYWVNAISLSNDTKLDEDYEGIDSTVCKNNFDELIVENTDRGTVFQTLAMRMRNDDAKRFVRVDGMSTTHIGKICRKVEGDTVWVNAALKTLTKCSVACAATAPRKSLCDNHEQQIELDPSLTFWAYLAVRVFIGIIGGTAFAMFEGAVIAIVRDQKADYGLQRVYGSIGGMISSPLSGLLIDYASRGKGYTDFRPAFYLYAVLKVLSGVLMLSIDLEFKQPAQNLLDDFISVFRNVELVALFIACFLMGTAWGYIESFLFWLLQDLGASRSLMGITITVAGIAGLPLLVLSGPIIKKLGHANVLFIGFLFYAIRLLGYSLIYNPWLCLVFEALESVTSSLSFTAAVTYAASLSSTTTDTSVQGLLGGIYYGVGKGSGSLIGGYLMKFFGTRPTYQLFAAAMFVTGCLYYLFNQFYIRKRTKLIDESDICKKKPSLDIEGRDASHEITNKETEKMNTPLDVATKTEVKNCDTETNVDSNKPKSPKLLIVPESTDGSSDSGFDNPAYNENDSENSVDDVKKNDKPSV